MTESEPIAIAESPARGPAGAWLDLALVPVALLVLVLLVGAVRRETTPPPALTPVPGYAMSGFVSFSGGADTDVRVVVPPDAAVSVGGDLCYGTGPHADLATGSPVLIHDEAGKELGRSVLYAGATTEPVPMGASAASASCTMWFRVPGLPATPKYFITVGDNRRYEVAFEQLEEWGWGVGIPIS